MPHMMLSDRVINRRAMITCHTWWHPTPDVVRPCMLPKEHAGMPRPTLSNCVCSPKAMMACHAQCHLTVCVVQERWLHAKPDVVGFCLLPKCDDSRSRPTSSYRVCCPRAMMECHARRHLIVCSIQRRWKKATADVIRSCILSKGDDDGHTLRCLTIFVVQRWWCHSSSYVVHQCVLSKGNDGMKRPTLSDHVCCPRTRWNAILNVVQPFVLFKVNDGI